MHPGVVEDSSFVGRPSKPPFEVHMHHVGNESFDVRLEWSAWIIQSHLELSRDHILKLTEAPTYGAKA